MLTLMESLSMWRISCSFIQVTYQGKTPWPTSSQTTSCIIWNPASPNENTCFGMYQYIHVYTGIYLYIPVPNLKNWQKAGSHTWYEEVWTVLHSPCGSQCDANFEGLPMHTYILMKDTSFAAVKSEKNEVQIMCLFMASRF